MRNNLIEPPGKNAFFREQHEFRPIVSTVDIAVGLERQFFAVTSETPTHRAWWPTNPGRPRRRPR